MEDKMLRVVSLNSACSLAFAVGLLSATAAYAQQGAGGDLSPAKNNCSSATGCANYPTGNTTSTNPTATQRNVTSPTGPGGDLSPAKSNCDSPTGCANYPTGAPTKSNPTK